MKPANIVEHWKKAVQVKHPILDYFPDAFLKKPPPRRFYLMVLYCIYPDEYKKMLEEIHESLEKRNKEPIVDFRAPPWLIGMMSKYRRVEFPQNLCELISASSCSPKFCYGCCEERQSKEHTDCESTLRESRCGEALQVKAPSD